MAQTSVGDAHPHFLRREVVQGTSVSAFPASKSSSSLNPSPGDLRRPRVGSLTHLSPGVGSAMKMFAGFSRDEQFRRGGRRQGQCRLQAHNGSASAGSSRFRRFKRLARSSPSRNSVTRYGSRRRHAGIQSTHDVLRLKLRNRPKLIESSLCRPLRTSSFAAES